MYVVLHSFMVKLLLESWACSLFVRLTSYQGAAAAAPFRL